MNNNKDKSVAASMENPSEAELEVDLSHRVIG
jgi:hypothetical protein